MLNGRNWINGISLKNPNIKAYLTAAYELLKTKKYEVIILESEKQVGGISKTINYKGNRMDLGGHRFFSKDERVNSFWREILEVQGKPSYDDKKLNIQKDFSKHGPNPEKEDKVFLIRNRVSRVYYCKKFFSYPISLSFNTIKNLESIGIELKSDNIEQIKVHDDEQNVLCTLEDREMIKYFLGEKRVWIILYF